MSSTRTIEETKDKTRVAIVFMYHPKPKTLDPTMLGSAHSSLIRYNLSFCRIIIFKNDKFKSDLLVSNIGKQSEMDHISQLQDETRAKSILDAKD